MQLTIRLFATLKDRVGAPQVTLHLPAGATVADTLSALTAAYPAVEASLPSLLVSVNQEYADREQVLQPDDEIALFPPVSGG
ncbi:MAG: MoaD/ThiS family protein [Anaerolineales bacterium]